MLRALLASSSVAAAAATGCFSPPATPRDAQPPSLLTRALVQRLSSRGIDFRRQRAVTPVQQQHPFGACWSFGATGTLEGIMVVQGKKPLEKLSEQQLISCESLEAIAGGPAPTVPWQWLLDHTGGWAVAAADYRFNHSCNFWREYPTPGFAGNCTGVSTKYAPTCPCPGITRPDGAPRCAVPPVSTADPRAVTRRRHSGARVGNWTVMTIAGNQDKIVAALSYFGPAAIGVNATCLMTYAGGVIDDCASEGGVDHAVLLVGAGETPTGQPYFIVKNSWGLGFGEAGYFRMERNSGQLAFSQAFFACYAAGCTTDGWEERWQQREQERSAQAAIGTAAPAPQTQPPTRLKLSQAQAQAQPVHVTGAGPYPTGFSLALSSPSSAQPIIPHEALASSNVSAVQGGGSVVRVGVNYHMLLVEVVVTDSDGAAAASRAERMTCQIGHWRSTNGTHVSAHQFSLLAATYIDLFCRNRLGCWVVRLTSTRMIHCIQ